MNCKAINSTKTNYYAEINEIIQKTKYPDLVFELL